MSNLRKYSNLFLVMGAMAIICFGCGLLVGPRLFGMVMLHDSIDMSDGEFPIVIDCPDNTKFRVFLGFTHIPEAGSGDMYLVNKYLVQSGDTSIITGVNGIGPYYSFTVTVNCSSILLTISPFFDLERIGFPEDYYEFNISYQIVITYLGDWNE